MSDKDFLGGRKEKSLGPVRTNGAERRFAARSLQVHTHLRGASAVAAGRAGQSLLPKALPGRRSPRGAQPRSARPRHKSSLFLAGAPFSAGHYGLLAPKTKLRRKKLKPQAEAQSCRRRERGGTCLRLCACSRPERFSLPRKNNSNSAAATNPPRNSPLVPADQAGLAGAGCCHGSGFRLSCISH